MKKIIDAVGGPVAASIIALLILFLLGGGLFGGLIVLRQARDLAGLRETIVKEREEAATRTKAITQEDLARLLADNNLVIQRQFAAFSEALRVIQSTRQPGGPIIIERDVRAPTLPPGVGPRGPAGPPGTPGTPGVGTPGAPGAHGTPGQPVGPLIPAGEAPAAREAATERVLLDFVPGSLLNCETVGLEAHQVELLRDPTGRLASTARCVWRVRDQVKLTPAVPLQGLTFPRWEGRLLAGYESGLQWIAGARLTRNLDRTWGVEVEGGRSFTPPGSWWWRVVGTWRAF